MKSGEQAVKREKNMVKRMDIRMMTELGDKPS